jgi:integrase
MEAYDALTMKKQKPTKGWLESVISGQPIQTTDTLRDIYKRYALDERLPVSDKTRQQYTSLVNNIKRYEAARNITLTLDRVTTDTLRDFAKFLKDDLSNSPNTVSRRLKRLRSFIRWANGLSKKWPIDPLTHNNPFDKYSIGSEQYGTPFYLTIDERNTLEVAELPPRLAIQRDIFVFQCLIGCRISDLWAMTKDSIINGAVEYIPRKTKEGRPITVRVPLNSHALAIVERYKDNGDTRLFPFIAQQQYNEDIKEMLRLAGITRIVTILDPTTRQEVKRPINEVASSHMARRTFIGNLYKQVKDPNLVCKLSGHKEGSKAFARYRDIDDDMAKELVKMLE